MNAIEVLLPAIALPVLLEKNATHQNLVEWPWEHDLLECEAWMESTCEPSEQEEVLSLN